MKRILLWMILVPTVLDAQITITKNNFPSSGDEYIYSLASTNGVDVSTTGANVIWDYSTLSHNVFDTAKYVSVTSTPFAYQFYFNNQFLYPAYKANYAIKGRDLNAFNQVNITDVFQFHKKKNSALQMVGFGANINGVPASIKYDTIDQLYPLPLTFGVSDSTSAYYLLDVPNMGTYGQWLRRKVEVDGWGDLTTPYQNYPQALRVKTTLYQRDTLKTEQPVSLPGIAFNRPVQYTYEWFVLGVGVPVLSVTEQAGQITNVKYIDVNTSGIASKFADLKLHVFPNPSSDFVRIDTEIKNGKMNVFSLSGKVIYRGKVKSSLDVSEWRAGNYVITVEGEQGKKGFAYFQKIDK